VPQKWKAIDLHVFVEWHPHHLDLGIELESPEDYPTDEAEGRRQLGLKVKYEYPEGTQL